MGGLSSSNESLWGRVLPMFRPQSGALMPMANVLLLPGNQSKRTWVPRPNTPDLRNGISRRSRKDQ